MQKIEPIEYGYYYHIYNRGIDGMDLFRSDDNYSCFMELYFKYTEQVVDTYVWCLMKNHFHFLVRIKDEDEMGVYVFENNSSRSGGLWKVVSKEDLPEFAEPGRVEKKGQFLPGSLHIVSMLMPNYIITAIIVPALYSKSLSKENLLNRKII
jgi:hypothetical protein